MDIKLAREEKSNREVLTSREYYVYCRNLGVDPCSSWTEIRKKAKALYLQFHTDKLKGKVEHEVAVSLRDKDFQTNEIFRIVEISIRKLTAHRKAVRKLSNQDLLSSVLVSTSKNNTTANNKQQNQLLFAYLLLHARDDQLLFVCSDQQVCNVGLWTHTELISLFPIETVVSVVINMKPWLLVSLSADYMLMKTLLSSKIFSRFHTSPSYKTLEWYAHLAYRDLLDRGAVKKATVANFAIAICEHSLSSRDMLISSSNVNCFGDIESWSTSQSWSKRENTQKSLAERKYLKTFMMLVIDQFETLDVTLKDQPILQAFFIAFNHVTIQLSDEFKQRLAIIYRDSYYTSENDLDYLMWLTFDREAVAQFVVNENAFYFSCNYSSLEILIRAAKIAFERHGDDSLIRKYLPNAQRLLRQKFDEMAVMNNMTALGQLAYNWCYMETLRLLSAIKSPDLSDVERNIGCVPTWENIRDEVLDVINRYVVINVECQQLLAKTRRVLFKIDIEEDLSDYDKVLKLFQSFSELVSDINLHVGDSAFRAVKMKKQLLPLIEEFYTFIEKMFYMLSIHLYIFDNLEFICNPAIPIEPFAKLGGHDKKKFMSMGYLRFHHMATHYSRAYFKPDWDITVYEALDRLRILAHQLSNQKFGLLFKDAKKVAEANLINNLVCRIQYLPPEQILEELQAARKKEVNTAITGFNAAVDGIQQDINENILLLTYTEDDLLKLTNSDRAFSEDENLAKADDDLSSTVPGPSKGGCDDVD